MSEPTGRHPMTLRPMVHRLAGMGSVHVQHDIEFVGASGASLHLDLYQPTLRGPATPVVVIVEGYPDPGFSRMLGCRFKDMACTTSLARLIAASGMAAIAYTNCEPAADLEAVLDFVRGSAEALHVDASRLGLWGSSGHGPLTLGAIMTRAPGEIACAVLSNPYTMDLDGSTLVAEAAAAFRFVNGAAGRSVSDLPIATPLFIARSGKDEMPGLNDALDHFVAAATAAGLSVEVANHPEAAHAFDLLDDSDESRRIIAGELAFLAATLSGFPHQDEGHRPGSRL
jgi:hypothetical protein